MSNPLSTSADALGGTTACRPALTRTRHMAAADHYAAAHAAFAMLEAGGNSVDAGVAAGIPAAPHQLCQTPLAEIEFLTRRLSSCE